MPRLRALLPPPMGAGKISGIMVLAVSSVACSCSPLQESRSAEVPEGVPPPPDLAARSGIVADLDTGAVLYAKDATKPCAVASTQKLLAALIAVEAGDPDREVTIREEDLKTQSVVMPLRPGDRHSRRELVRMMLVASANDAARALARDIAGSSRSFAEWMNRRAASLGMEDTRFLNPHGLTVKGQHSTARDLAIVARAAYRQPFLREACGMKALRYQTRSFPNGNRLLGSMPGCDGLKSGYTRAAGRCLVATAVRGEQVLVVVLLGGTDQDIWPDAEKLFRWAAPLTPR